MAFVCPGDEEKKLATLDAIAGIVKELQQEYAISDHSPCCKCPNQQQEQEAACDAPAAMICCKVPKAKVGGGTGKNNRNSNEPTVIRLKQSKSRELRASIMYVGCDCEKRNGLQDDCQRTECHGSPECLTKPYPTCGPSEFCNGKHLGRPYPAIGNNITSGLSYGNTVQNTKTDNIDCLEYEYQCFPIDGLDIPCCEENPYSSIQPSYLDNYQLCPNLPYDTSQQWPNCEGVATEYPTEYNPVQQNCPVNSVEPVETSLQCRTSQVQFNLGPSPESCMPLKPCIRDIRQAFSPPEPYDQPIQSCAPNISNYRSTSCSSNIRQISHRSSNVLLAPSCLSAPENKQRTVSGRKNAVCSTAIKPKQSCGSGISSTTVICSLCQRPMQLQSNMQFKLCCPPRVRTSCSACAWKEPNTCATCIGTKTICWCYTCNRPADCCRHQ